MCSTSSGSSGGTRCHWTDGHFHFEFGHLFKSPDTLASIGHERGMDVLPVSEFPKHIYRYPESLGIHHRLTLVLDIRKVLSPDSVYGRLVGVRLLFSFEAGTFGYSHPPPWTLRQRQKLMNSDPSSEHGIFHSTVLSTLIDNSPFYPDTSLVQMPCIIFT